MSKKLKIELTDGLKLSCEDCINILSKYPRIIRSEEIIDAVDMIIAYFYRELIESMIVDVNIRNSELEPRKEMTLEEIENELGYKVKIVSEEEK